MTVPTAIVYCPANKRAICVNANAIEPDMIVATGELEYDAESNVLTILGLEPGGKITGELEKDLKVESAPDHLAIVLKGGALEITNNGATYSFDMIKLKKGK